MTISPSSPGHPEFKTKAAKMKNDGKDVIYYDCESWLMQPSMNTEFFSLSLDSAEKSILKLLSYADYESVMDKTQEATYFNILKNYNCIVCFTK